MRLTTATIPAEVLKVRSRDAYYARQKHLFALAFAVASIVPLVSLHYSSSRFYQDSWMEKTSAELAGSARDRRDLVDLFLETQEAQLATLVELYTPAQLSAGTTLETLFRATNRSGVMTDLGVIDRTGEHLAYVGPFRKELAGRNYSGAEWFAEAMRTGRYVSDVFTGYRKVPHIVVAVTNDRKEWILRATIDSGLFNGFVASANVGPGGDAFIVNDEGRLQTPSRHAHDRIPPEDVARIAALAGSGRKADVIGGSLYSAARLNGGKWLLVLETNVSSSLAAFYSARRRDAAIISAAAGAVALLAVLVTRSMVNGLARAEGQRVALSERVRQVEKMALVGRLAASVAHEINNPLQIVSQHAGLVGELLDDASAASEANLAEYRRSIRKIHDQVTRATAITRRLLGFSRSSGRELAPTDVNRAVEDTVALLEGEARRNRISIARDYQADLPTVRTDASQLQQIVLNVLSNAMDAIGQGGQIRVSTRIDGRSLLIDLSDTGPGLSPEVMESLFDPFFTTKQDGKGTGLGLFVSREIAERLGGDLAAANGPAGGSVFTVRLPLTVDGLPGPPVGMTSAPRSGVASAEGNHG